MSKTQMLFLTLCAFLAGAMTLAAADARPTDAEREKMLKEFKRIPLNTTEGDAMFLRVLVQSRNAQRGVEVGSATGYGAVQMGIGFERTGGKLITVDIDPKMVAATRENLKKFGLEKTVTVVEGDALQVLPKLEGTFDFVFIDALKRDYLKYFKALEPKLRKGAVIVADNVIKSEREMTDFLAYFKDNPNYDSVTIRASMEKDDGMLVIFKVR
ncbi:MAG: class I SAM-dependent methyltransferase [Verrucomicrobiae bacterium]|nr:class I SAM-dependent methyltransferase [Verrucomicrobiae bacterium]